MWVVMMPTKNNPSKRASRASSARAYASARSSGSSGMGTVMELSYRAPIAMSGRIRTLNLLDLSCRVRPTADRVGARPRKRRRGRAPSRINLWGFRALTGYRHRRAHPRVDAALIELGFRRGLDVAGVSRAGRNHVVGGELLTFGRDGGVAGRLI